MSRSTKKGPFIADHLLVKIEQMNSTREKKRDQDVVARIDDRSRHGRPHDRRARWPQARPDLRAGEHGRPQARRIRADATSSAVTAAGGSAEKGAEDHGEPQPELR